MPRGEIWSKYLEMGVETNFGQKTACPVRATFFPDLEQKITGSQVWDRIWVIQIFGYLDI